MQQLQHVEIVGLLTARRSEGMILFDNFSAMFIIARRILVPSDTLSQPSERIQPWESAILGLSVESDKSVWPPRIRNEYSARARKIGSE